MKRLNEKQWRDEKELRDAVLLKAVDTVVTESSEERVLDFRISTETADSYNDVIKADGWDLARFEKNPVVLWAHDHGQPPVGQALSVGVDDGDLVASAQFADAETYAFADTVFRLLKKGFLRATSVGFFPKEWTYDEDRGGYNFINQELFEFSIVPVPANPDALALAVADGIDCTPIKEWAEKSLDLWTPDDSVALWIPRSQIEDVYRSLSPETVTVSDPFNGTSAVVVTEGVAEGTITGVAPMTSDDITLGNGDDVEVEVVKVHIEKSEEGKVEFKLDLHGLEDPEELSVEEMKVELDSRDDEIEDLKAQVDQLETKISADEEAEQERIRKAEADDNELFDVIDIDSHEVENEIDRAVLDLDIDPEELQVAIRRQLEHELMKTTGKLPKEV